MSSLDDSFESLPSPDDDDLAHSFRKRRLTYSKHHIQNAAAAALLDDASEEDKDVDGLATSMKNGEKKSHEKTDHDANDSSPPSKRIKSTETSTSDHSDSLSDSLRKRILHAGEIIKDSHSASHHHHNHLPAKTSKWRQRFSFCSTAPDTALPFPRRIVGTYSCHGMEPVYDDSDYEHSEGSSSDDDKKEGQTVAKINQDRGGVAYPFANSEYCALFGVYDGHGEGGEMVSQYALGEVQRLLEERLVGLPGGNRDMGCLETIDEEGRKNAGEENSRNEDTINNEVIVETTIKEAFEEVFVQVDRGLLKEPDIEPMYSGTTACVALLRQNKLYIGNAGDSRAVLARRTTKNGPIPSFRKKNESTKPNSSAPKLMTIPLSIDQNPDSSGEKERIIGKGGYVSPPPEPGLTARVWLDAEYTQIGLAMARSIGDHAVKDVGVIADPVVTVHEINEEDEFVILATDGVWEFITSEDAVNIVSEHLYGEHANNDDSNICASKACEALIKAAMEKWHEYEGDYRDDITAIVVRLKDIFMWKHH